MTGTTCDPSTTLSAVNSAGGQHRAGQTRRARSPRRRAWEPSPLCSADAFPKRPRRRAPSPWCMPPPSPRVGLCCVIGTRLMSFPPAQRIPSLPDDGTVTSLQWTATLRPGPRTQSFLWSSSRTDWPLGFLPLLVLGACLAHQHPDSDCPPPLPVCLALVVNSGWRLAQILSGEAWGCPSAGTPKPPHPQSDARCWC